MNKEFGIFHEMADKGTSTGQSQPEVSQSTLEAIASLFLKKKKRAKKNEKELGPQTPPKK